MLKEKSITSFKNIDAEKFFTVGLVIVLAHQSPKGVELLLFDHKKSDKIEEGMLGLPSETMRWNRETHKTEAIKDTITRCFYEEMDYSIKKHQFFTNPGKVYQEMPFTIKKPDSVKIALGRVVTMWTDEKDFLPSEIDTPEVKGAGFYSIEEILNPNSGLFLRDNTLNIVSKLHSQDNFVLGESRRSVNSFENRGWVPVELNPDVRIKK